MVARSRVVAEEVDLEKATIMVLVFVSERYVHKQVTFVTEERVLR